MRFERFGGSYQLVIQDLAGLRDACELDDTLWVATSAPTNAYRGNADFLQLLDGDADGRVRSAEVRAAINWYLDRIEGLDSAGGPADALPIAAISARDAVGAEILESCRFILGVQDLSGVETVDLKTIQKALAGVGSRLINGDGIAIAEAAEDSALAQALRDALVCTGGTSGVGGRLGLTRDQFLNFFGQLPAFLAWHKRDAEAGQDILPLGPETAKLAAHLDEHAAALDRFFAASAVVAYDAQAQGPLAGIDPQRRPLSTDDASAMAAYLLSLPLAAPNPSGALALDGTDINPAFRPWFKTLADRIVRPLLGEETHSLTTEQWQRVKSAFYAYRTHMNSKPALNFEAVPVERLEDWAAQADALRAGMEAIFKEEERVAALIKKIENVKKLLLLHRHLIPFANNYVSFPDMYAGGRRAFFEQGSLVMDQRHFNFCLQVTDLKAHMAQAQNSSLFVLYVEIAPPGQPPVTLAVPVTSGSKQNLAVGKRGVFYDIDNRQYDARIVNLIENPVSIWEALCMPFVKLWRSAEGKIEKWSGSAETQLQKGFDDSLKAPAPAAAPNALSKFSGTGPLVGLGVVTAALGSSFAFITKTLSGIGWGQVVLAVLGGALVVVLPVSTVAFMKLRKQDLSALLEGSGWAINARMRLDRKQRHFFTHRARFPKEAAGTPRKRLRGWVLALGLLLVALAYGIRLWH